MRRIVIVALYLLFNYGLCVRGQKPAAQPLPIPTQIVQQASFQYMVLCAGASNVAGPMFVWSSLHMLSFATCYRVNDKPELVWETVAAGVLVVWLEHHPDARDFVERNP